MNQSKLTSEHGGRGTAVHITPDIDFTKEVHVLVGVSAPAPTMGHVHDFGHTIMDMRFSPFITPYFGQRFKQDREKAKVTINVTKPYLYGDGFDCAVSELIEFYQKNTEMIYDTMFSNELIEHNDNLSDETIVSNAKDDLIYYVNCWLGIIDHFGFEAPYTPAFIQQMTPAFWAIIHNGFREPETADLPINQQIRIVNGKSYTFQGYLDAWKYMRQRYCCFIKSNEHQQ